MPRLPITALVLTLVAVLGACSSDDATSVPEGYTAATHPAAEVAVPEDWTVGDPGGLTRADPDAVDRRVPDVGADLPIGIQLWRFGADADGEAETYQRADGPAALQAESLPPDREQTRSEAVDVPGAAEGHLLQVVADSPAFDDPVRATYVVALREDGAAYMLQFLGTEAQLPDDVIDTVVSTFRLTDQP